MEWLNTEYQSLTSFATHIHRQTALPAETWPLSDLGLLQAQRLAEQPFWQDVHIICTSVEPKAIQTAQIVAERHDLPVEPSFDLRELRRPGDPVGDYESVVRRGPGESDEECERLGAGG